MSMYRDALARMIDHTLLKPFAVEKDIDALCDEAVEYGFMSVCVAPCWVSLAYKRLKDSDVKVCTVIGFPGGFQLAGVKAFEARQAVAGGAAEVDAVINIGYLKSGRIDEVAQEISGIVDAAGDALVKIIIETCYLSDDEKVLASRIVRDRGADFVKTSTGFGSAGAKPEDIALIKKEVPDIKIKASGGIRTFDDAMRMINAGASRIGTSAGPDIIKGSKPDG